MKPETIRNTQAYKKASNELKRTFTSLQMRNKIDTYLTTISKIGFSRWREITPERTSVVELIKELNND